MIDIETSRHKPGGKFRKKRYNFAMVSNSALQDPKLSLKAKGLYGIIQSLITLDNDVYKWQIMKICQEGERAFESAWKELKEKGYLIQCKISTKNGFVYKYKLDSHPSVSEPKNIVGYNHGLTKIIKKKYNYTCQRCGEIEKDKPFHAHHIVPRKTQKLVNDENNLILLCPQCHKWVHSELNVNSEYIIYNI